MRLQNDTIMYPQKICEEKKSFSDGDDAVAKEFNEFFNSIGQNTVEKIYSLANECSYDLTQSSFCAKVVSPFTTIFI